MIFRCRFIQKVVHDWLVKNTAYDYDNYVLRTIPQRSYGMEGVMLYGKAVCQGYAEAFSYFMDTLGIENDITISIIYYPDINEYNGRRTVQIIINNYC